MPIYYHTCFATDTEGIDDAVNAAANAVGAVGAVGMTVMA